MNELDSYYEQSSNTKSNPYKSKREAKKKYDKENEKYRDTNYEIVSGASFYTNVYEESTEKINVLYYQIAEFNNYPDNKNTLVGKRNIRAFVLLGAGGGSSCSYSYNIIKIKNYNIHESKLKKFLNYITSSASNKNRIKYKFYPVYNFDNTEYPSGNDINECVSELLY